MQLHEFDRPVINLHELTNGLGRYFSPEFNREIVSKKPLDKWGYFQSLGDIVEILDSVDHYKTSRLAHYHIIRRGDSLEQQVPFYNYLNENFYIIACRRTNVFEHALSLTLSHITKKLNVYNTTEKVEAFIDLYRSKLDIDQFAFINTLENYRKYLDWSQQYFNVASYFNYEDDLPRIEQFILNLPIFGGQTKKVTWQETFGINFNSYNQCHYSLSDIGTLFLENRPKEDLLIPVGADENQQIAEYQRLSPPQWPAINRPEDFKNLPTEIRTEFNKLLINENYNNIVSLLGRDRYEFVRSHQEGYQNAKKSINRMVELGVMISGPPIKKQTLMEKRYMIKNFDQCLDSYNRWIQQNPGVGAPVTEQTLTAQIDSEKNYWINSGEANLLLSDQPPTGT